MKMNNKISIVIVNGVGKNDLEKYSSKKINYFPPEILKHCLLR